VSWARAADDAAVLAAGLQPGGVPLRGRFAMPQADTEIDQRPAQRDAAFPADPAIARADERTLASPDIRADFALCSTGLATRLIPARPA
jgi:hypothetical protein